eukprot:408936_1
MAVAIYEEPYIYIYYYYFSCIGSVVAFITISIILFNITCEYIKIFHSSKTKDNNRQDKLSYILFILMCIVSLLICCIYSLFRVNIFNGLNANQFTKLLCKSSHYSAVIILFIYTILMYTLFIYRIQMVFVGTIYEYSPKCFLFLYTSLLTGYLANIILTIIGIESTTFNLYIFKGTNQMYCGTSYEDTQTTHTNFYSTLIFVILTTTFTVIVLYMFTNRLYALQSELVKQYKESIMLKHMHDQESKTSKEITENDKSKLETTITANPDTISKQISDTNITDKSWNLQKQTSIDSMNTVDYKIDKQPPLSATQTTSVDSCESPPERTISLEQIITDEKKGNDAAKRIMSLHKLIKKYSILMSISLCSIVVWFLLTILVSSWMWAQIVWFFVINTICSWLMFGSSYKYWKLTTKYGCCSVCYCNKKKK